jgi:hypothetical protein
MEIKTLALLQVSKGDLKIEINAEVVAKDLSHSQIIRICRGPPAD